MAVAQGIDPVKGGGDQAVRQDQREEGKEHGLAEELHAQLEAKGADGFADADFTGTFGGAGCRKVHEVDAGDKENDQCDSKEDAGIVASRISGS